MKSFRPLSAVEQLAAYLREEIQSGGLDGEMPGVAQWVRRLGVGTKTVVAAMELLKREGVIQANGERKRSGILAADAGKKAGLRIRILLYEESDKHNEHIVQLGYRLEQRGHHVSHAAKTLVDLSFDVKRVARMVEMDDADAWVVQAGSRAVLEWFAARPVPAFALFGRQFDLPMASIATLKSPAVAEALQRLVAFGHRRIVMLAREERRKPTPGLFEQRFLDELERLGIQTGAYHLPDWEDDAKGFHRCLDSLFRHSPPTALFVGEPALFFATQQYLLGKGLVVSRDVSLVALDYHPSFAWFRPEVSHIRTDTRRFVLRVIQWVENLANGKADRRETLIQSEFVEGGTIGPTIPEKQAPSKPPQSA
jgi:DNA-binding LacI/PurR family transcriptional regulator/DNA-binding transcriptional regulator YhcF (GntR family)